MAQTDIAPPPERQSSLSWRLWNLDWEKILPWSFEEVTVVSAHFDDALPFMTEHYARIFGTESNEGRFLSSPLTEAKRRFSAETDVFLFQVAARTVGLFMAHPSDWSTYYMRTAALLPEYRGRHLVSRFMERICEPLREAGVERLCGDVSPANTPMMKLHVGQGFLVTSIANSERWGSCVHFTKFLRQEADAVFRHQFCNSPPLNRSASPSPERSSS